MDSGARVEPPAGTARLVDLREGAQEPATHPANSHMLIFHGAGLCPAGGARRPGPRFPRLPQGDTISVISSRLWRAT
jgi:hypothetical protein